MIQHVGKHALKRVRRNEYRYGPVGGPTALIKVSARPLNGHGSAHVKLLKHRVVFSDKTMERALTKAIKWIDVEVDRVNKEKVDDE